MNVNAIIAVLVLKNILNQEEGQHLADYIDSKPQPHTLNDAINDVRDVIGSPLPHNLPPLAPVGPEQAREELQARQVQPNPGGLAGTPTEFPTLPGSNESTGNDLSISEMSDTAKATNETGNQEQVVDAAKESDSAPAEPSDSSSESEQTANTPTPKSEVLASAVKSKKKTAKK